MSAIMWFRRDLRLADNPALNAAMEHGQVLPLMVLNPAQLDTAGEKPRARFLASVHALNEALEGRLVVRIGSPAEVLPSVARELQVDAVYAAQDFTPFGVARDAEVAQELGDTPLKFVGSPYAVAPGRVLKNDGTPYRVFTPFYKAWLAHGWRKPADGVPLKLVQADSHALPAVDVSLHGAIGEQAALERFQNFLQGPIANYAEARDVPSLDGTSWLSPALRFGEVHPRTLLAHLGSEPGHDKFRSEVCWREFYADVLVQSPQAVTESLDTRFEQMPWSEGPEADAHFAAWQSGRTGFPLIDAGMRQLLETGWMHNRVRMVVASFLVKHLNIHWRRGAEHFMQHLLDGDTASNSLSWQWVAGCGTDAAPYVRVFNPLLQAHKFDTGGDYVRKYVPELRGTEGGAVHEPWLLPGGIPAGYPEPIIDLAEGRAAALSRYELIRIR